MSRDKWASYKYICKKCGREFTTYSSGPKICGRCLKKPSQKGDVYVYKRGRRGKATVKQVKRPA